MNVRFLKLNILLNRHKCSACYKQYKKKEHLIEHMKISCHSAHDPKCPLCKKHCKSLESVREHLTGIRLGVETYGYYVFACSKFYWVL